MNKKNINNNDYLTYSQLTELETIHKKERRIISIGLIFILVIMGVDFFEDIESGSGTMQLFADLLYGGAMLGMLLYIWRNAPLSLNKRNLLLTQEVINQHEDAEIWRARASELLNGLSSVINQQLQDWQLTRSEKEVALLLLKGLSLKEIAALRETGERTVRQQAGMVYSKAGINSRSELSAFFLEDLLLPAD